MERIIKRGDIFYATLNPVIGSEQGGTRPVLTISNNTGNRHSPTIIVAPITSRTHTKAKLPTHTEVKDFDKLDKDSIILLEQIRTIDKQRLKQYMQKILSQSVKTLRLYIRTQNCVPMQVSRMTNCVYIVAPTHVETVVLLSHKKPDGHINVKVEFGEGEGKVPLDNIAKRAESYKPKERVTYKMIKEYIEAKYGFKVHTAYIAEVKRDLGLPMYDAPNAVEELKQPRKHPTAEKVEAIKDALKHFEII